MSHLPADIHRRLETPGPAGLKPDLIVHRHECSEKVWALLGHREDTIRSLQDELRQAYGRLCKHEGHVLIGDDQGRAWCELCETEVRWPL